MTVTGAGESAEFASALNGFVTELKGFQADVKDILKRTDTRMMQAERKSAVAPQRPILSQAASPEAPHRKAFDAYLRGGDDEGLRGLVLEGKGLNTAVNAEGGYLVDPQTSDTIRSVLRSTSSLRRVANVVQIEAGSFEVLVDTGDVGSGWVTEASEIAATGTAAIERIAIPLHELTAMPKASQRLLDDSAFDLETWLADRIAERFSRAEALAFVSGDGSGKPKGFLAHTKVAQASWEWGKLGYVATGTAGDFNATSPANAIVDLVYALNAAYRANATFVMNSKTAGAVRKMKDSDGRFLWSDSLAAGEPARLMGYPVLIAEDMPDIAANSYSIAFGDFHAGYTIAERPDLRVLRDPFSAKPHVLFYASRRVGGDVSDFGAIKLMKFATS
ncbi:phage major capsid protein [Falsigemmobacter faecalis]|uniref:Phage major capsid protein n=1 Tax=Falsigemmobacter faecalis TaxID=2488730 RepID=A0A3P3DT78_9RHOB|nr:phage major capsid protein [Falsigemmobacter faecalis]RRH77321.1 phage major capsid protein [Falsigemmobacter faecalis]